MPSPRRSALTLSLIAAGLIVWLNRGIWFYGDDWAYFTIRYFEFTGGQKLEALFSPHNEHWVTLPVAIHLVLQRIFGLRTRLPYVGVLALAHATVVYCTSLIVFRSVGRKWLAWSAGVGVVFLSSGFENLVWTFQITFVGAFALGLVAFLLIDSNQPSNFKDALIGGVGVLALATAGTAVAILFALVALLLIRGQWRRLPLTVGPGLTAFAVWYAIYGRDSVQPNPTNTQRLDVPAYVWRGVSASLDGLAHVPGVATVLIILIGLAFIKSSVPRKNYEVPVALAVGGVFFFTLNGLSRVQYGIDQAASSRYLYLGVVFFTPIVAVSIVSFVESSRRGKYLSIALLLWLGITGITNLTKDRNARATSDKQRLSSILATVQLADLSSTPNEIYPSPQWDIKLTLADLVRLNQYGMLPARNIDETYLLDAMVNHFITVTAVARYTPTSIHKILTDQNATITSASDGCIAVATTASPTRIVVYPTGNEPLVLFSETQNSISMTAGSAGSKNVSGAAKQLELVANQAYEVEHWRKNSAVILDLATPGLLTLCGVSP